MFSPAENAVRLSEARTLLDQIRPHIERLPQADREWVLQKESHIEAFGDRAIVTPKQLERLREIGGRV